MTKDCRIVVRMSEELRDWVHDQAQLGEQDDAAFVRMVLSNLRRGTLAPPMIAPAGMVAEPMAPAPAVLVRDMLHVSSAADVAPAPEPSTSAAGSIDVDAMVGEALEEAEAQGLTQPQIEEGQGDMPQAGVRALFRRPVPFSRGTAPQHLQQMLGT